jgi:hypothetical protein
MLLEMVKDCLVFLPLQGGCSCLSLERINENYLLPNIGHQMEELCVCISQLQPCQSGFLSCPALLDGSQAQDPWLQVLDKVSFLCAFYFLVLLLVDQLLLRRLLKPIFHRELRF